MAGRQVDVAEIRTLFHSDAGMGHLQDLFSEIIQLVWLTPAERYRA
jgi:hypothetical protein